MLNSSKQCLPALTVTCSTSEYSGCPTNSCITCPTECTDCTRNWISNFPVAFCTACSTGFKISGNVCLTTSCV